MLTRFQAWVLTFSYWPPVLIGSFIVAICWQSACEANRGLWLEEQRAVIDAAKRQGKTIVYEGDNSIGRVKE